MKEQKSLVEAYRNTDLNARQAALATVVRVRGSSYRSPGARMLITDDGKWVGSISGGCLEGDALRKARQVMISGKPLTVTYDTSEESNQHLGIGLGCNGIIDVLIEPLAGHTDTNPIDLFEQLVSSDEPVALATVFASSRFTGEKLLINAEGQAQANFSSTELTEVVVHDLQNVFESKRSEAREYVVDGEKISVFLELIQPAIRVIIFGGGFDARPVSQLAKALGWHVSITDECVAHIAPLFFPSADKLSLCQREFVDREFAVTPYTACILMSHNYEYDKDVLRKIMRSEAPYIGILGPRKRFDKMLAEFAAEGIHPTANDLQRIHSPIGLDIGAEAPDEIAVSIVAEIQGKFSNRSGGFLKYRSGPIHQREPGGDDVFKQIHLSPTSSSQKAKP